MRALFAALSLMAVAVFAYQGDRLRYRFTEVSDRDVEPFRAGQTYKYRLDTQISSGMATVSEQHAVSRLQAEAWIHFQSERSVTLKLQDVIMGSLNQEVYEPEKVQPMGMFKENTIKSEEARLLELPCTFDYVDGLVERIRFSPQDKPWSKNIKKAVLNMLQLNLKQRQGHEVTLEQDPKWEEETSMRKSDADMKMFVMPETTLEGECQVTYTLNNVGPRDFDRSYRDSDFKLFNVTKSINFQQCSKIADTRYGPKMQKPCDNSTTPEQLEGRKLERSTIVRHVVVGTPEKYGIKKVEIVSHYLFKTLNVEEQAPMHVIVAGRLSYTKTEERRREMERELKEVSLSGKQESLLYSTEWDENEKLFYMYGDEEFPQRSPFDKILTDKVDRIEKLMKQLVEMWTDKTQGIQTEATIIYTRVVEILRMCTQDELKEVYAIAKSHKFSGADQIRAEEILIDALANAGTFNTIKVLTEKILKKDLTQARAVRALAQLRSVQAPSYKQVEILGQLCQNEICRRHESCHQVCWLTTSSIMSELCNKKVTVQDQLEQKKDLCQHDEKKSFVKKIMGQFDKADTKYEKILLLKALGNAGLEPSIVSLEKIIRDIREEPIVRMQAIDSLRRLRATMPHKIQRILLPIFQNVRERPEVRMMAISQILATIPAKPILDQLGMTLIREPSRQVKSYVYGAMKKLSESPIDVEKDLARHLQSILKLANIQEEDEETLIRGSRYYRIPVYSQAKKEGVFMELESMVGADNFLPKHLAASMETYFNGLFQKNSLEVSFTQEDVEKWVEKLADMYMEYYQGESMKSLRGYRSSQRDSWTSEAENDFQSIIRGLGIKLRSNERNSRSAKTSGPYGMLNFRYGDIDYAILPFEEELFTPVLKKVLAEGRRPSMSDFEDLIDAFNGRSTPFRTQLAINVLENSIKLPTSVGFPLRMCHLLPVLASFEGQVKPQLRGSEINAEVKIQTSLAAAHIKRIEILSPIVTSGVESTRTGSLNLPLNAEIKINDRESKKPIKVVIKIIEHKIRALSLQTLPMTFTTEHEWNFQRTPIVKRIENKYLVHRAQPIKLIFGKSTFGLSLRINGEVHWPQYKSYGSLLTAAFTTENHLEVVYEPIEERPREIVLLAGGKFFQPAEKSTWRHRELKGFHKNSKFDREFEQDFEDSDERSEERFDRFVDNFEPKKMIQHSIWVEAKTVGGSFEKEAMLELESICDAEHRYIKTQMKINRSPIEFFGERAPWTMESQAQIMFPETHLSVQQYKKQQGQKQQKFVCQVESEWGNERKQKIVLNINGEQAHLPEWRRMIREVEETQPELKEKMIQKVAFLNKYDISAQYYKLEPRTKNFFNRFADLLKSYAIWNTKVELKSTYRDGQITGLVVIDPMTHEHVNVTIETPMELIKIDSLALPAKVKPFKLVRPSQPRKSIDSFHEMIKSYTDESRPECKVDGRKIRTFDDVSYKAPLTKCYSVLAKDCSSSKPKFAVLMKKINENEKALKVLSNGNKIEIEPVSGKLIVKINGKTERDVETLEEYGVYYSTDLVRVDTRDVSVQFDGEEALVRLSSSHKNTQCGLCGHYDDNTEDEFRTSENEWTMDLKKYHKSYSMVDTECREDLEETHRREEYQQMKKSSSRWEEDEDRENRRRSESNDEIQPFEKTEVMEYNHKICFSMKPVKACPEDSFPGQKKDQKISFSCLDRSSHEARRLLREARRATKPMKLEKHHKISFVETITMPTSCLPY